MRRKYHKVLKHVVKGGFLFGLFGKSKKPITISKNTMDLYGCDGLTWAKMTGNPMPSYTFLTSSKDIANLQAFGKQLADINAKATTCTTKKTTEYKKKEVVGTKLEEKKLNSKIYRFCAAIPPIQNTQTPGQYRERTYSTFLYKECAPYYKQVERASLIYIIRLLQYMAQIVISQISECKKGKVRETIRPIKCIMQFFNDPIIVGLIFGDGETTARSEYSMYQDSSSSTTKRTLAKLVEGTPQNPSPHQTTYFILSGVPQQQGHQQGQLLGAAPGDLILNASKTADFLQSVLLDMCIKPALTNLNIYLKQIK